MSRPLRFLCDTGAQCNLVCENVIQELQIPRRSTHVHITGVNGRQARLRGEVVVQMWHRSIDSVTDHQRFVIVKDLGLHQPPKPFAALEILDLKEEELADPKYNVPGSIDGIIGAGVMAKCMREGIKRHHSGIIAQETTFGWIFFGEATIFALQEDNDIRLGLIAIDGLDVVQKLWEIEDLPDEKHLSIDDRLCEQIYESTVVQKGSRYRVTLPFKPEAELGESRAMALRRLYCLENRFKKNRI